MGRKNLLFLSAANCEVCTWQSGELSAPTYFSDNAEGHKQFTAFLQTHRNPTFLLTDLVEEDFRQETVPHLRGNDRTALIQRKLEQYYRDTLFRQAITLQRSKEGRRDDNMLFSALTNPALITPWLNIMLAHSIALVGIYSIPNTSAPLVKDIPSDSLLLLSWEKHAGLRQTYFDAKRLRFSRLTSINGNNSFCATAGAEASRTQQYLKNLSLLPSGQALNVAIICHSIDRRELESHLSNDDDMHYAYLDIQELGRHLGSKTIYLDSDATPLFLHLLAAQTPRNHYAAAEHTHSHQLLLIRRSLLWLSAAFITASLLWVAANIKETIALENESKILKEQTSQLSQEIRQIVQRLPSTPVSATDMKTAVLLSRSLNNISPPPQIILDSLAKTLNEFPAIRIDKLSWQTSSGETSAASAAAPQGSAAAIIPAQVILLSGALEEFTGDYRAALDHLERFRQALIQRGYSVTVLTLPLDVSPQGSIAADTGDGSNKPAQFSLKIFWRMAT
jgi:hypothetical protein